MGRINNPVRLRAGRRRATDWVLGFGSTAFAVVATGTKVLLGSIALSAGNTPGTIVRTRGTISIGTENSETKTNRPKVHP